MQPDPSTIDIMSEKHQLLGPLESIDGVLMIGASAAVMMTALQDVMAKTVIENEKLNIFD